MTPALTIKDVAVLLSVNERTVYRLVQRGELPAFKVAGAWRLLADDVEKWVQAQKARCSGELVDPATGSDVEPRQTSAEAATTVRRQGGR